MNPGTRKEKVLPGKGMVPMMRGDVLSITTASGGGWGKPSERDPELIAKDLPAEHSGDER
jgi:N-methylhydantoinase B/oxoprolinase/acetone carboxylase alpha subunit